MTSVAAKLEADPKARARAVTLLNRAMSVAGVAAALVLSYLSWAVF
jgi:hypothetical protein